MSLARQFFREMRPFFRMLDDVSLARPPPSYFLNSMPQFDAFQDTNGRPALDLSDKGDKYVVEADLPGIPKDNIQIRIGEDRQSITIEGKVEEKGGQQSVDQAASAKENQHGTSNETSAVATKKDSESDIQISSERPFTRSMSFARTVWLPRPVDANKVSASMNNGVLTITVNKSEDKASTIVPID